jgi:hypothetical protein
MRAALAADEIRGAQAVGSALKSDRFHRAASFAVDDIAEHGTVFALRNRTGTVTGILSESAAERVQLSEVSAATRSAVHEGLSTKTSALERSRQAVTLQSSMRRASADGPAHGAPAAMETAPAVIAG